MPNERAREAILERYGLTLSDELLDAWSEPETLVDDEALVSVLAKLAPLRRSMWEPIVRDDDGTTQGSRYGGTPWLGEADDWPACPLCHRPLQLFLQLASHDVPNEARALVGEGIVQLFYCAWADSMCGLESDPFEPFASTVVARRIQPTGTARSIEMPSFDPAPRARAIVGWKEHGDYPTSREEIEAHGAPLTDEQDARLLDCCDLNETGDKLGGWPSWVQQYAPRACPKCERPMRLVFQLRASNVGIDFGGGAIGWLTRCETHAEVLAFYWQR